MKRPPMDPSLLLHVPVWNRLWTCVSPSVTWVFPSGKRATCLVTTNRLLTVPTLCMPNCTSGTRCFHSIVFVRQWLPTCCPSHTSLGRSTQLTSSASTGDTAPFGLNFVPFFSGVVTLQTQWNQWTTENPPKSTSPRHCRSPAWLLFCMFSHCTTTHTRSTRKGL